MNQHPHAVDTDQRDHGESHAAEDESGVLDSHGQGEDTDADVALQNVDDRLEIAEIRARIGRFG